MWRAIMSKPKAEKTKRTHVEVKKVEPTRIRVKVVPAKGHTHFEWRDINEIRNRSKGVV